jgi:glycosyltransferase involved in cell wall biosynthesis
MKPIVDARTVIGPIGYFGARVKFGAGRRLYAGTAQAGGFNRVRQSTERHVASALIMGTSESADMKLTIVIPAYNEEEGIASIIKRTLAARTRILQESPVDEIEIIVVSDGSTDRTEQIAARFQPSIRLIVFEENRGYGAAIKRGFEEGAGEFVGFLDADGTCDPAFFSVLCAALVERDAAVAIGSRLGRNSRMPVVRRFGNRMYASILSTLSNKVVTDTASGMRVIRRDALPQLYPLPDGLHFTPAMSARVLMDERLRLVECPMPYEERIGESKLNVFRDGVRFLRTILEMTLHWRPAKLFIAGAVLCLGLMTLLIMHPIETWTRTGHLREDMIYRLLFCALLGSLGAILIGAGVISDNLRRLWDRDAAPKTYLWKLADRIYSWSGFATAFALAAPALIWLVGTGVWTWTTAGYVTIHWSRVVLAGLILFALIQQAVTTLIANVIHFHIDRAAAVADAGKITAFGVARVRKLSRAVAPALPTT